MTWLVSCDRLSSFLTRKTSGYVCARLEFVEIGEGDSKGRGNGSTVRILRQLRGADREWLKFDPNPFAKGDLYFERQAGQCPAVWCRRRVWESGESSRKRGMDR